MATPYWSDDTCALYLGKSEEILLELAACIADPPYGQTSLEWDRWPTGWPTWIAAHTSTLWCFGSLGMFGHHWTEFTAAGWKDSHDVVWEKHNGSGFQNDRFKRVHEQAQLWYRGRWEDQRHQVPTTPDATARTLRRKQRPTHMGEIGNGPYASQDGGPRLMRSVIRVRSMHGRAIHPTEKPVGILQPLIEFSTAPGDLVLDPFAGSGSTLEAARLTGRRAVGIERHEPYAEAAALRLSQGVLDLGSAA